MTEQRNGGTAEWQNGGTGKKDEQVTVMKKKEQKKKYEMKKLIYNKETINACKITEETTR